MTTSTSDADQQVMQQIRTRLMATGDWQRISKLLEARLNETGYTDDLRDIAKETARSQDDPNLTTLIETITPKAKGMMNDQTRSAVLQEIEAVLERLVEKA